MDDEASRRDGGALVDCKRGTQEDYCPRFSKAIIVFLTPRHKQTLLFSFLMFLFHSDLSCRGFNSHGRTSG